MTTDTNIKTAEAFWKESLKEKIPSDWKEEIDGFESEIFLKKQGKIDDKIFAESRLRRGAYGQRYDNGHRHDGTESRSLNLVDMHLTKGPGTYWNAPGMLRIKLPYGGLNHAQMLVMADLAEEYSDSIIHITTRQDIQFHYIHIEDTPSMFRRLAAVGITTQEACGNSVRNVTACPYAGVCSDAAFDVTSYAEVLFRYLLGHPDVQDFGRKFKISLSGCRDSSCGLSSMHDMGLIAVTKEVDGKLVRGFEVQVGGGLGAVPYKAQVYDEFVPETELLAVVQGICRVYARLGEKKKRHMARIKFLVAHLGIEEFKKLVIQELKEVPEDPRWKEMIKNRPDLSETPLHTVDEAVEGYGLAEGRDKGFDIWAASNIRPQAQKGYVTVAVNLPLGDMTSSQMRELAKVTSQFINNSVRTTVEQNLILRWVRKQDVYSLYQGLLPIGMALPGAESIVDITTCPGTDTCKLGISSSRGLTAELRKHLAEKGYQFDVSLKDLKVKVSGCFNSCGQQHLADIGFYGTNRVMNGFAIPHFQLLLGGEFSNNGGNYGIAIGNYPSKAIPQIVDKLVDDYLRNKELKEDFRSYVQRVGKKEIVLSLKDLLKVPLYEEDKSYYTDWGDIREFTMKDKGIGECAGEVVSLTDFGLKKADRELFEAQILVDEEKFQEGGELAFQAMKHAAQAMIKLVNIDISEDSKEVLTEFTKVFYDTELIFDPFGGDRFVQYYFKAHEDQGEKFSADSAQRRVEESRLFIESTHSCNMKIAQEGIKVSA